MHKFTAQSSARVWGLRLMNVFSSSARVGVWDLGWDSGAQDVGRMRCNAWNSRSSALSRMPGSARGSGAYIVRRWILTIFCRPDRSLLAMDSLRGALGKTSGRSYKAAPRQLLQVDNEAATSPSHPHPHISKEDAERKGGHDAAKEAAKMGAEHLGTADVGCFLFADELSCISDSSIAGRCRGSGSADEERNPCHPREYVRPCAEFRAHAPRSTSCGF